MTTARTLLQALRSTPLLGDPLTRARASARELGVLLAAEPDPRTELGLIAWEAERAGVEDEPDAVDRLAEAGQTAAEHGARELELHLALLTARALARAQRPDAARELLDEVLPPARARPSLASDWRLAVALCGVGDVRRRLEEALQTLPSPAKDHERLSAHLALAQRLTDTGDLGHARDQLQQALAICQRHQDDVGTCHSATLLGHLLLEMGQEDLAEPHLRRALQLAEQLDDPLTQVTQGVLLSTLQLRNEDWQAARQTAEAMARMAARRQNWPAWADAHMTQATCMIEEGSLVDAVVLLLRAAGRVRTEGSAAAVNLLKARIGELRAHLGGETFDPIFQRALMRIQI